MTHLINLVNISFITSANHQCVIQLIVIIHGPPLAVTHLLATFMALY